MKSVKWMIASLMLFLMIGAHLQVLALDTGLVTQSLPDEEISNLTDQPKFTKITSYTPLAVECFDVRDDHMVVIGADAGDTAVIAVYDQNGNFQYGFETAEPGSFRVMWSEDVLAYYSIRSKYLFKINEDGKIIDVCIVESTKENSIYDRDVLLSTTRTVGNSTYHMINEDTVGNIFSSSFEKITKVDSTGTTVVYAASSNNRIQMISGFVILLLLLPLVTSIIIAEIRKHRNKTV